MVRNENVRVIQVFLMCTLGNIVIENITEQAGLTLKRVMFKFAELSV